MSPEFVAVMCLRTPFFQALTPTLGNRPLNVFKEHNALEMSRTDYGVFRLCLREWIALLNSVQSTIYDKHFPVVDPDYSKASIQGFCLS